MGRGIVTLGADPGFYVMGKKFGEGVWGPLKVLHVGARVWVGGNLLVFNRLSKFHESASNLIDLCYIKRVKVYSFLVYFMYRNEKVREPSLSFSLSLSLSLSRSWGGSHLDPPLNTLKFRIDILFDHLTPLPLQQELLSIMTSAL